MNLSAISNKLLSEKTFKWFLGMVFVFNLIHTGFLLDQPFTGQNAWRDAQTYGVARNFIEEDGSFLEPKYDVRNSEDGRLPGEFPLQTWYAAGFMKMFGISLFNARLSNFILGLLALALLFAVTEKHGGITSGLLAIAIFTCNPLAMTQVASVMPETMVSFLFCLALFFYFYIRNDLLKWFLVIFSVTLCTLVKPSGYVIIVFFIVQYFFTSNYKITSRTGLIYGSLVCIPIGFLLVWIKYTLQFEHPEFGYPITHHYVRTFKDFVHDLDWEVISTALEKTFRHGFNIAGILGLLFLIFRIYKTKDLTESEGKFDIAVSLWILGSIAFLLYAGIVQNVQLYYASPLIIPAIILVTKSLSVNGILRIVVMLVLLLQTNIKVNTFNANFFDDGDKAVNYRLEPETDKWSIRKDLFIVYPFSFPDFTMLGRLGRRGYNLDSPDALKKKYQNLSLFASQIPIAKRKSYSTVIPYLF